MFLSTENPPNDPLSSPPCSNLLHLTSSSHELGQSHLSNFSIRDYAYSNRKKNIKNSWPFSSKSLHLLSTHGVTDPLPPFDNTASYSSSGKQILSYAHLGRDLAKLEELNQTIPVTRKKVVSQSENGKSVSKSKVEIPVVVASNKNNSHSKKSGRGMDSILVTTKSESIMASKTCPICKTFSSASNTTLNAHIDQCLSVDSSPLPPPPPPPAPPVVTSSKPKKPKVIKPQVKVKTMVEIYKTAKGCTLEDLDRRNGTKWVSILSQTNRSVADNKAERSKKKKVLPVGVGPVYIDDKGQKLRILSEFSKKKKKKRCISTSREQLDDGSSEKKSLRRQGKKHLLKLTNHKASEILESRREFTGEGSSKGHRRIYNQRMLAKRGVISKKINDKGHKNFTLRDQPSETDDDDSWSEGDPNVSGTVSGRNKSLFGSKSAHSSSSPFTVGRNEKEKKSFTGVQLNTLKLKRSLSSIQEDKYSRRKNFCSDESPRGTKRFWRQQSMPVELKKARLDFSRVEDDDEEEEETWKWESEMTRERQLSDEVLFRTNPSSSGYDDYSTEEEEDNDKSVEWCQSDSSTETIPDEQPMYYSEDMIHCEEENVRFDSQRSLFVEVDNIPIPGPPGSFLPSPRDMGFDENVGNSSVITSQVQSSIDQLDRNSSESPVSAVSNFAAGRMHFPSSLRENISSHMSFCVPSHHYHHEVLPLSGFRNNDSESCCCQRKDSIALNHQASHLLQRRTTSSSISMNITNPTTCLDQIHPFAQSPYIMDCQSKFSSTTVPPSPSNPVLRLMGKDLMVMNQGEADEEASRSKLTTPSPQLLDDHPGLYFNTGLYLRNSFDSTHHQSKTPQAKAQASTYRNNFDHGWYFPPS